VSLDFLRARRLKQAVAPFLPERLKAPLRFRLFGFRPARTSLTVEFAEDARGPFVVVGERVRLRYRDADRLDMRYHFVENGESIDEVASFISLAESARTLFDVGAAKGIFSQIFCLLGADKRAVAFEPSSAAVVDAAALADMNRCAPRITLRPVALGREVSMRPARLSPAGFINVDAGERAGAAIGDVIVTSLDAEVAQRGVVPDLIKIDVEGYEYEVLAGARCLLGEHKPPICLELHLDLLEQRGQSAQQVLAELESHGYRFQTCVGAPLSARRVCGSMKAIMRLVAV
jgi:FkbM family methyltransferase